MLIRITCRYTILNWQQVIEVEGIGDPCAGNREASYVDQNNHCYPSQGFARRPLREIAHAGIMRAISYAILISFVLVGSLACSSKALLPKENEMDVSAFWSLIENARGDGEQAEHVERVQEALMQCTPDQIVAFDKLMSELEAESYTWELWGAAYIVNGGCSDDGFDYFRGWLILQGRDVFEVAIAEPDNLADYPGLEENAECEDLLCVASKAYQRLTGKELPIVARDMPDLGDGWDFDDESEMTKRYPKLTARFY